MVPKRGHGGAEKGPRERNRVDEWLASVCDEAAINELVFNGVLPDREVAGWWPAHGEAFLTPNSNELVVFTSFFLWGFGIPVHPFLLGALGVLQD
jgi:hypothetical protein